MEEVKLKFNMKIWFGYFVIFFFLFTVISFLMFSFESSVFVNRNILSVLLFPFCISVVGVGVAFGAYYCFQKKVTFTDSKIKITKIGFPSETIAYKDIKKIKFGMEGFKVYGNGKNPVDISIIYTNFNEAKKLLFEEKLKNRDDIQIKGFDRFIKKYLD